MAFVLDEPIIQNLGMQGEYLNIKVTFPLYEVNTDISDGLAEQGRRAIGVRSIVLDLRAEDLPMGALSDVAPHFDVGRELRERWGNT